MCTRRQFAARIARDPAELPPIGYSQAVRFSQHLEQVLTEFDIGLTARVKLEIRFDAYADAYRAALVRKSDPEVLEYLDGKYRQALAAFDDWVYANVTREPIPAGQAGGVQ